MSGAVTFTGGPIFDGTRLREGQAAVFEDGRLVAVVPEAEAHGGCRDLDGHILSPGFVDLQVNGGGGVMLGEAPSVATLARIAQAHRALGTVTLLPTLITDRPGTTRATIDATEAAVAKGIEGIAGLHLEGPHLDPERKGAHDTALIRPMTGDDLDLLRQAAHRLPVLKVTLAPEAVTPDQVAHLAEAGVVVALGHSDCDYDTACRYEAAGARLVTHLFNAMSQVTPRAPGLVGAALDRGGLSAGVIADGIHVHPANLRAAWAAKRGHGRLYLVTDAMAVAGTVLAAFDLGGRRIHRREGRLTLADGTLAGADIDMLGALRVLRDAGIGLEESLPAATSVPAGLIGREVSPDIGDWIRIAPDLSRVSFPVAEAEEA